MWPSIQSVAPNAPSRTAAAVWRWAPNRSHTKTGMHTRRARVMALGTVRIRSRPGSSGGPGDASAGGEALIEIALVCASTPFTALSLRAACPPAEPTPRTGPDGSPPTLGVPWPNLPCPQPPPRGSARIRAGTPDGTRHGGALRRGLRGFGGQPLLRPAAPAPDRQGPARGLRAHR